MYDLKISHVGSIVLDDVLQSLDEQYGNVAPLTTTQWKIHNYLRMVLDFRMRGNMKVTIPKHIQIILDTAFNEIDSLAETPATNHLFQVLGDGRDLSMQQ